MLAGTALCGSGLALAQDAMPGADAGMMTTNKTMAKDDAAFFQKAAMSGMTEIAAAKVAVAKSGNPEIKNFANKMIKDHSQADNELKALAKKKGVTLPTALDKDHQDKLDRSEEHTSELQSLMRISYAVFCWKKKPNHQ